MPNSTPRWQEPDLEEAFERIVDEGEARLGRPLLAMCATGVLGGIDVGTGVLFYLVVHERTGSTLLAGLAFPVGFVALLLARSELFTENFLVPVLTVVARRARKRTLLRLWVITLLTNLLGGWVMTGLIISGIPTLKSTAAEVGGHYAHLGANWRSFALAILAGLVMTLMTRMQHATESLGVKLVPAILFGALLASGQLFHSILDSLFMFAGLWSGDPGYDYLDWLAMMSWAALGNLVGGLVLVTGIRLVQMRHRIEEAREAEPDPIR